MEKKRKLSFEIIPDGCWKVNLHELLPKSAWERIKKDVKTRAAGKCEICGKVCDRLDAHEVWGYDVEKGVQKLENIVAICRDCHDSIHINRSYLVGRGEQAEDNYMKVNGVSYAEMKADLKYANERNSERNKVSEWRTDFTYLNKYDY